MCDELYDALLQDKIPLIGLTSSLASSVCTECNSKIQKILDCYKSNAFEFPSSMKSLHVRACLHRWRGTCGWNSTCFLFLQFSFFTCSPNVEGRSLEGILGPVQRVERTSPAFQDVVNNHLHHHLIIRMNKEGD